MCDSEASFAPVLSFEKKKIDFIVNPRLGKCYIHVKLFDMV